MDAESIIQKPFFSAQRLRRPCTIWPVCVHNACGLDAQPPTAYSQNQSLSGMIRKIVEERIQEENDLQTMKEALADYQVDGKVYSLLHVKREFGIQ